MNNNTFYRCVEITRALKPKKETGRNFITCFAIRKSKIMAIGYNDYTKLHRANKYGKYVDWKGFETDYRPSTHAEISMCIRLGEEDLGDYELLNVRIGNRNQICLSAPCCNCARVLKSLNPKKIFYSNNAESFSELDIHSETINPKPQRFNQDAAKIIKLGV